MRCLDGTLVGVPEPKEEPPPALVESLYDVLAVDPDASNEALERAYRRKARECHPDKAGGTKEAFQKLVAAYELLLDPTKRAVHDRRLAASLGRRGTKRRREGAAAEDEEDGAYRAAGIRAALLDIPCRTWSQQLRSLPADAPWVLSALRCLSQPPQPAAAARFDDACRELQLSEADVRRPATVSKKNGHYRFGNVSGLEVTVSDGGRRRYFVRLGWQGFMIETRLTLDVDEATAAHGAVLRMRQVASDRLRAGDSIKEAARHAFGNATVQLKFSAKVTLPGDKRRMTPMTWDLGTALSIREEMLELLSRKASFGNALVQLQNLKKTLCSVRKANGSRLPVLQRVAFGELNRRMWLEVYRNSFRGQRLRGKQSPPRGRPRRRLRGKQRPVLELTAIKQRLRGTRRHPLEVADVSEAPPRAPAAAVVADVTEATAPSASRAVSTPPKMRSRVAVAASTLPYAAVSGGLLESPPHPAVPRAAAAAVSPHAAVTWDPYMEVAPKEESSPPASWAPARPSGVSAAGASPAAALGRRVRAAISRAFGGA